MDETAMIGGRIRRITMSPLRARALAAALALFPLLAAAQSIDPLPPETQLVAVAGAPAATQQDFTSSAAQDLVVTFTDFQTPAALVSASVVVTQGASIVAMTPSGSTATAAPLPLPGAVGQYTLRVIGTPGAGGVGTFSVCVAPKAAPTACLATGGYLAGNITQQSAPADPTLTTIAITLNVGPGGDGPAGTYTFTYSDQQFPVALNAAPTFALFQGSTAIQLGIPSGAQISLAAGTYTLLAIAKADPVAMAGLFGLAVTGPASLIDKSYPVGLLGQPSQPHNPSAQSVALTVTDFSFPSPLAQAIALATAGSTMLGKASAGHGPSNFPAPAGPLQVWTYGAPGAGAGTYEVDLTSASASLEQSAFGVNSGNTYAYAFVSPSALGAGPYVATANDFQFPVALASVEFAVAQNQKILKQASAVGSLNFTATAVPVVLLVAAIPNNGNGMFDVNVQTGGGSPQLVYDQTQTVSASGDFTSQTISFGTAGNLDVTLQDLQFPAQFQTLALVGSSAGAVLGKVYGGGTFTLAATPGQYQFTIVALPGAQQQYGLYGLQVVNSAPTVTLTASPTAVVAGAATTLSWTSTNATACTGSGGGFAGAHPAGTSSISVSVSATTTYQLTCTGPGGSGSATAIVTATAAPAGSGGGGAVGWELLGLLATFAAVRSRISILSQPHAR